MVWAGKLTPKTLAAADLLLSVKKGFMKQVFQRQSL